MSNSLIVLLAILVWIPFTLYYFRKEIAGFGSRKKGGDGNNEINIEDCLGTSQQIPVAPKKNEASEEEERVEVPFYMAAAPGNMEVVPADEEEDLEEWAFEEADMQQGLLEEKQLQEVEHDLREPYRSEEDDRRIADELHTLQTYEVFNALREDARLRTQEILAKYPPPPPPVPLPDTEEPLEEEDGTGMEEEGSEDGSENVADEVNDFLNS